MFNIGQRVGKSRAFRNIRLFMRYSFVVDILIERRANARQTKDRLAREEKYVCSLV